MAGPLRRLARTLAARLAPPAGEFLRARRHFHAPLPGGPIAAQHYVVFDLEATGLRPSRGDAIVSIGAVRVRNAEAGRMVFDRGHVTPATTVVDAEWDEALDMPSDSPWPIAVAAGLALVFTFLLTGHWTTALVFLGTVAAATVAWHRREAAAELVTRRALPNGWWGMAVFLATETALFGSLKPIGGFGGLVRR